MIDLKEDRSERVKYDYPDFPIYIRRGLLSAFPNYTADSHWHDDIELIAVITGEMLYNINGHIVTLREGEGILVNAKQFHYGFSKTKTDCDFICILFHPLLLCVTKMFETDYVNPILNSGIPYFHLSPNLNWQYQILEYIKKIYDQSKENSAALSAQGYLYLLWRELVTHTDLAKQLRSSCDSRLSVLKGMVSYIHTNYKERITLADIAAAGHVSKRTCGTLFLTYQNKTPVEFLTDYRLRKSIELMKHSDLSILEIGLSVGFSGASYYAETFRKCFGISPAAYRKTLN